MAHDKPKHAHALLKAGANPEIFDSTGRGLYHMAVELDNPTCLQYVLVVDGRDSVTESYSRGKGKARDGVGASATGLLGDC